MLSFEEARAQLRGLEARTTTLRLPLVEAAGKVCAQEVRMDRDQPGFDRATMDGYALRLIPGQQSYPVVGEVRAGTVHRGPLEPGQAVRIMTGAPCPADVTVVPVELTDAGESTVRISEPELLRARANIAMRGEDARAGDPILRPGIRLGPAAIAAAAMAGQRELEVYRDPRVGIVTTGDEVGGEGEAQVRDTNGPLLIALLQGLGCPVQRTHAPDDEAALEEALRQAADASEVVVTTGGVSAGTRDLVPETLARLGFETVFHKVAVQPGKPILIARRDDCYAVGLPGNPVSVLATAHLFLLPVLRGFWGSPGDLWLELPMAVDHHHRGRRHLFLPARLSSAGIEPVRWNGSGDMFAAASGDGLISLPPDTKLKAGGRVPFLPYSVHQLGQTALLPPRGRDRAPTC